MFGEGERRRYLRRCTGAPQAMMAAALFVALVSLPAAATGASSLQERSRREAFLRTAEVISEEIASVGITRPARLELEKDGVRRSSMFKAVEIIYPGPIRVGRETQDGLRDSWKYEVAAYELDRLLGLDLVPVTVMRQIGDREGALIDWVDGVLPDYGVSLADFDMAAWEDEVAKVWLFDYLAYNIDRTPENLLVTAGFGIKLIDHGRAFQRYLVPMRPLSRFPRAAIQNLRQLSDGELSQPLLSYLAADKIAALLERRRWVLARVDTLLRERAESEVLF